MISNEEIGSLDAAGERRLTPPSGGVRITTVLAPRTAPRLAILAAGVRLLSDIESTMFRTTAPHHQDPLEPDTIAPELADSVAEARAHTATGPADPSYLQTYVRSAMFDAVVALLIRHRLPIDADRTRVIVNRSANDGDHAWVARCAEYIAQIAREKARR